MFAKSISNKLLFLRKRKFHVFVIYSQQIYIICEFFVPTLLLPGDKDQRRPSLHAQPDRCVLITIKEEQGVVMLLLDKKILDFLKNRLFFHYILNSSYLVFRLDLPFINTLCTQHVAHLHIQSVCTLLLEPDSAVSVFLHVSLRVTLNMMEGGKGGGILAFFISRACANWKVIGGFFCSNFPEFNI